jgi:hypothetical protein
MARLAVNTSNRNESFDAPRRIGILHGNGHAGDPLRRLGAILTNVKPNDQRRWVLDARGCRYPVALIDLACFANQVRSHPNRFSNLAIAWVDQSPMSSCLRSILESLPMVLHEFDNLDTAMIWLREESWRSSRAKRLQRASPTPAAPRVESGSGVARIIGRA